MRYTYYIICQLAVSLLLSACSADGGRMRQQLTELEERNRSGERMLNDTLAEQLVGYFDRHGSSNERMRARYILGRTYFDLGELPRALETYFTARDCADTTSADCDYKTLSRIHAQSANVFDEQYLLEDFKREIKLAEHYAWKAGDALAAIGCHVTQTEVYKLQNKHDSVVSLIDNAIIQYRKINCNDKAAQISARKVTSLLYFNDFKRAKESIDFYESSSGYFDSLGNIEKGREFYYYVKGNYYLAVNKLDSAEYLFRKELRIGKDMNNQIAGCKGLQELYAKRHIPDSIAKYATLSYELNDSAYTNSAMVTMQKLTASYNFNYHRMIAERKAYETKSLWLILMIVCLSVVILLIVFSKRYYTFKKGALDYRLKNAGVTRRFVQLANNYQYPSREEWLELRQMIERKIPQFRKCLFQNGYELTDAEYDVCLLTRVYIKPIDISRLKKCTPAAVSKMRKKLLLKIYNREGSGEDFDDEICKIV